MVAVLVLNRCGTLDVFGMCGFIFNLFDGCNRGCFYLLFNWICYWVGLLMGWWCCRSHLYSVSSNCDALRSLDDVWLLVIFPDNFTLAIMPSSTYLSRALWRHKSKVSSLLCFAQIVIAEGSAPNRPARFRIRSASLTFDWSQALRFKLTPRLYS